MIRVNLHEQQLDRIRTQDELDRLLMVPHPHSTYLRKITGDAVAAVSVVLLDGPYAETMLQLNWRSIRSVSTLPLNRIHYGHWVGSDAGVAEASEDVIVCRVGQHAYEIHCHGGHAASTKIISDLIRSGAVESSDLTPSELIRSTKPSQAAMLLLPVASTHNVARVLLNQANGAIEDAIASIVASHCSADQRKLQLQALIRRSEVGLRLLNPPSVAILGPPNAGKSTLLNALLGWERAIVHSTPGTTRDVLKEDISLEGWPLSILDTAGLRATSDDIESQGIAKARKAAELADLVLLTVDPVEGWTTLHEEIAKQYSVKVLVVQTKIDLLDLEQKARPFAPDDLQCVRICAPTGEGIGELIAAIVSRLGYDRSLVQGAVPFLYEQVQLLRKAFAAVDDPSACREILSDLMS